jgi:hypothetical protein
MERLYERLTALLGTSFDEAVFQQLLRDVGEIPEVMRISKRHMLYGFPKLGFNLDTHENVFTSLFLHSRSASVKDGYYKEYGGNLPADIAFHDHRSVVEEKLGVAPLRSQRIARANRAEPEDLWEYYQLGALKATFMFDGIACSLGSIGIHCDEGEKQPHPAHAGVSDDHFLYNFSDEAQRVIKNASAEARRSSNNFVGSEMLLLGLLVNRKTHIAKFLHSFGVDLKKARGGVFQIIGKGSEAVAEKIPFTPRMRIMLWQSEEESKKLGHKLVYPEHILLAMIEDGEGVGPKVLTNFGVDLDLMRESLLNQHQNWVRLEDL